MMTSQSAAELFFEEMKHHRVAFGGIGVSHTELIRLFASKGIPTLALDRRTEEQLGNTAEELRAAGAELRLGEHYLDDLDFDIFFRTPGMYFGGEQVQRLRKAGILVTSELEVFLRLCPCPTYGITGSDGKTTTSTLISELLKGEGFRVFLGGNIGKPLLSRIESIRPEDRAVIELSSFQLISMRVSPTVSVITNITPNHLDVHKDMQEYIDSKRNIYLHQGGLSRTVLGADNDITASLAPEVRGQLKTFSSLHEVERGCFLRPDGMIIHRDEKGDTEVMNRDTIRIVGAHNTANYMTAISAVWGEVSLGVIRRTAKEFGGVEHRIELVRELDSVKYYNDSIATSPSRTNAALDSFEGNLVLIAGGSDKNIPFEPMADRVCRKVKKLILIGVTGPKIEKAVRASALFDEKKTEILHAEDLKEATALARKIAVGGDTVLLSPASASFDQFKNFEQRGELFKEYVRAL